MYREVVVVEVNGGGDECAVGAMHLARRSPAEDGNSEIGGDGDGVIMVEMSVEDGGITYRLVFTRVGNKITVEYILSSGVRPELGDPSPLFPHHLVLSSYIGVIPR
ncbi:hypothetical protein Tco_0873662 [Tanacetum coccineum]|uniref:Uncharacterized protein n=1 Tax=Tanacetum coccineum TaxID=301880 RepID=A0ABQ5BML5_9ASTR